MRIRLIEVAGCALLALGIAACDVDRTEDGVEFEAEDTVAVPDFNAPDVDVDVSADSATIPVPNVDVDVTRDTTP